MSNGVRRFPKESDDMSTDMSSDKIAVNKKVQTRDVQRQGVDVQVDVFLARRFSR